jgi:hypothetical protein
MNSRFGIDKIKVYTPDFELGDALHWNHKLNQRKSGELEPQQTPITNVKGNPLYGEKLFFNDQSFNAEIQNGKFSFTINPSKIQGGLTSDANHIFEITQSVQNNIRQTLSLDFDLSNSKISRIDFAVDSSLNQKTSHYADIIGGMRKKYNAGNEYPNGFLFRNTMHQLMTYDRGKKNELDLGFKNPQESHLMRFEARFTKSKAITSHCEFRTFSELLESPTESMHRAYLKLVNLHWNPNQTDIELKELDSTALMHLLETAIKHYPRNYIQTILLWTAQTNTGITAKELETALLHLGKHRTNVQKQVKQFNKMISEIQFMNQRLNTESVDQQVSKRTELINAFINPFRQAI